MILSRKCSWCNNKALYICLVSLLRFNSFWNWWELRSWWSTSCAPCLNCITQKCIRLQFCSVIHRTVLLWCAISGHGQGFTWNSPFGMQSIPFQESLFSEAEVDKILFAIRHIHWLRGREKQLLISSSTILRLQRVHQTCLVQMSLRLRSSLSMDRDIHVSSYYIILYHIFIFIYLFIYFLIYTYNCYICMYIYNVLYIIYYI